MEIFKHPFLGRPRVSKRNEGSFNSIFSKHLSIGIEMKSNKIQHEIEYAKRSFFTDPSQITRNNLC